MKPSLLQELQSIIASGRYEFTWHATERMEERNIVVLDVEEAILAEAAEIIEDYPDDYRGASCLVLGWTADGRTLHVQLCYLTYKSSRCTSQTRNYGST